MEQVERYLSCMREIKSRFLFIETEHAKIENMYSTEHIILHLRKILELIAFASITPNHEKYIKIRNEENGSDYRKDWHAKRILKKISEVNSKFYPEPFVFNHDSHTKMKEINPYKGDYLSKSKFEKLYDRLGKFLHADNPWGINKGLENFKKDIPKVLNQISYLLSLHFVVVLTETEHNLWMVSMGALDEDPQMMIAEQGIPPKNTV